MEQESILKSSVAQHPSVAGEKTGPASKDRCQACLESAERKPLHSSAMFISIRSLSSPAWTSPANYVLSENVFIVTKYSTAPGTNTPFTLSCYICFFEQLLHIIHITLCQYFLLSNIYHSKYSQCSLLYMEFEKKNGTI